MADISWNIVKNERLKKTRGVSFDELLGKARLLTVKRHHARPEQYIMLFYYKNYVWIVPFVKDNEGNMFLKTLYPSRKYTNLYKGGRS
jgi:hypothetical protein